MGLQLNLTKSAEKLTLSLQKAGISTPPVVEVAFNLDVSGSYERQHESGQTNDLMTRLVPWGLVFDPDQKLDVFTFSNGARHAHYVGDVNAKNYDGFVERHIIGQVPGWCGGTDYAPVLEKNLEHFGWVVPEVAVAAPRRSFFGFGRREASPTSTAGAASPKRKSLVIFNTDGGNDDPRSTTALFERMEREQYGIYVMFIAFQQRGADFSFIRGLGDRFSNCGLTVINDLPEWVNRSDEEINQELITDELVTWLKAA